ncbi:hypothetical protein PVA45_08360 (plasmid) [Entomospira entomophila]|uniref:Uncharacterized protein n=1 Tax=Entomospira entomophila TaxID=2719988 RepID=A0A968GEE7_9SPIO|nr:hypothetical protein [Entomospira entomophilus]NIZ41529.1 hypothetical protein [Entomospira entomophilus]WDI36443.1 hypothetical protein PVA45_08360 [Entomospira entomophilus]
MNLWDEFFAGFRLQYGDGTRITVGYTRLNWGDQAIHDYQALCNGQAWQMAIKHASIFTWQNPLQDYVTWYRDRVIGWQAEKIANIQPLLQRMGFSMPSHEELGKHAFQWKLGQGDCIYLKVIRQDNYDVELFALYQ